MELKPEAFEKMEMRIPSLEPIMKTALEVLAELNAGDDEPGCNDGENIGGQGGGSMAVAVAVAVGG